MNNKMPVRIVTEMGFIGFFFIFCLSCGQSDAKISLKQEGKIEADKKYYLDIDYYSLTGKEMIPRMAYPCIEIQESGMQKIITFYLEEGRFFSKKYHMDGGVWNSFYSYKGDTSMVYSFEYIFKDKVIELNYSDTVNNTILDVMELKNDKSVIWTPENGLVFDRNPDNLAIIVKKFTFKQVEEYIKKDSILVKELSTENAKGQIVRQYKQCYLSNSRSIFWWRIFGHLQSEIEGCSMKKLKGL